MLSRERFDEIMYKNRVESEPIEKQEVTCTNGTSEDVLSFLKTLNNPETMKITVKELEKEMYQTFTEVHKKV